MAENQIRVERLYLAKEPDIIYVDAPCLPKHQYDGIRLIYRQYKKGKPGVILNDPSGYGKRIQTILFLSAMRPVMTLPALVLCTEGREEVWARLFHQWTALGSDVVVQKGNKYTTSMLVIGTFPQVNMLCCREWGTLVVDDTDVSKEALRAAINAKYKIWLTSLDMKTHLHTFSLIYKYLYPKDKFIIEQFQTDSKKPSIVFDTRIKLDTFMENVVIRRRDVAEPFGKPVDIPNGQPVSRKNKDATGRKIKRSKPNDKDDTLKDQEENDADTLNTHTTYKKKETDAEDFVVNIGPTVSDSIQKTDEQDIFNGDFINSENIVIKYDSDTDDEIVDDIPVKKTKIVTNENRVNEDLFSSDNVLSDKSDKMNNNDINTETNDFIDCDDILTQAY